MNECGLDASRSRRGRCGGRGAGQSGWRGRRARGHSDALGRVAQCHGRVVFPKGDKVEGSTHCWLLLISDGGHLKVLE